MLTRWQVFNRFLTLGAIATGAWITSGGTALSVVGVGAVAAWVLERFFQRRERRFRASAKLG